jgi:hypothetical protein
MQKSSLSSRQAYVYGVCFVCSFQNEMQQRTIVKIIAVLKQTARTHAYMGISLSSHKSSFFLTKLKMELFGSFKISVFMCSKLGIILRAIFGVFIIGKEFHKLVLRNVPLSYLLFLQSSAHFRPIASDSLLLYIVSKGIS